MEQYRIAGVPLSMYYIPNFITEDEEAFIPQKIPANKWISLSHRRLQAVPARLTATNTLLASPLPDWLEHPIVDRFKDLGLFGDAPHGVNHCLINEYPPGQGIMPHEDGAAYHPVVATVSLGGTTVLDVTSKTGRHAEACNPEEDGDAEHRKAWRILQEPRSLLVTTQSAYTDTLHGIANVTEDNDLNDHTIANWDLLGNKNTFSDNGGRNERTTRISLTFRDVRKVSTVGSKIFGKPRT